MLDANLRVVLPLQIKILPKSQSGAPWFTIQMHIFQSGIVSQALQINTVLPNSQLYLPLCIKTNAQNQITQPILINTYHPRSFQQLAYVWKVRIVLDGIDVSANLTNTLRIEGEEGTAKIAEFALVPFAGLISVTKWIGKTVSIFYHIENAGEWLLFQGVVDEPIYDPTSKVTTFTCTDQLQDKIQLLTYAQIDKLIGGYVSPIIFEASKDGWEYAQKQLSTLPFSLDLDKNNQFQLTAWKAKEKPDYVFIEDNILYQSIQVQLANRREIQNKGNITFQYRYQRLKQREIFFGYQYSLSFCEQMYWNSTLPNVDMIEQAISGTGWLLKNKVEYVHQRKQGWVNCTQGPFAFLITEELRKYLVREAKFILAKRFTQTVTENFHFQVQAPQSIKQLGEIPFQENVNLESQIDTDKFRNIEHYEAPHSESIIDNHGDYVMEVEERGQLNQAILTKMNQVKTSILKSHRNNLVSFKAAIQPLVERQHTIKIDTNYVKAQGKVKHVVHELDFNQGLCQSTITIAISRTDNDTEIVEVPFQAPQKINYLGEKGDTQRISLQTHLGGRLECMPADDKWDGYVGNKRLEPGAKTYPEKFSITAPAIEVAQAPQVYNSDYHYDFAIPNEYLILSA